MNRRAFLAALAALPLIARTGRAASPPAKRCILLYMAGGASQIDTWDPKPGRPNGGPFAAIGTSAGFQISEHLPRLATRANDLCVLRSLTAKEGNHQRARHLMHTGYPPQGGVDHPALGALVAGARPAGSLPGHVAIGGPGEDGGFLGAGVSPFVVADATRPVRNLAGGDPIQRARRAEIWRGLEDRFAAAHPGGVVRGQREVGERALATLDSPDLAAFRVEPDDRYGAGKFAAGCRMARQLVEAGVPFVEVTLPGWDTHEDNFARVARLSAELDAAMSALLDDLRASGLLAGTLVVWLGDFGRTPTINARGGRDHYPRVASVVLAGGGVRGGQVLGETDADGVEIVKDPIHVADLSFTLQTILGLDPTQERLAPSGRPIRGADGGRLLPVS